MWGGKIGLPGRLGNTVVVQGLWPEQASGFGQDCIGTEVPPTVALRLAVVQAAWRALQFVVACLICSL